MLALYAWTSDCKYNNIIFCIIQDDISTESVTTESMTTASSRDMDGASKGSLLDEFSSGIRLMWSSTCNQIHHSIMVNIDIALRCKRISSQRSCSGDTPLHKVCRTGKYVCQNASPSLWYWLLQACMHTCNKRILILLWLSSVSLFLHSWTPLNIGNGKIPTSCW